MVYTVIGTSDNDTLNQTADAGPGTIVGLACDHFRLAECTRCIIAAMRFRASL
jgi:hypothetical protein